MAGEIVNPQQSTEEVTSLMESAQTTVEEKFDLSLEYADGAMQEAVQFLNALQEAAESFDFTVPSIGMFFPKPISYEFDPGDVPVAPEVNLPMPEFPSEPILATVGLLTDIQAKLEYDLAHGGYGLPAATEDLIWRREEERARIAQDEANEKIASEWSKRGFDLPDGVLTASLAQSEIDYRNKRLDRSRDIAIKQVELAYEYGKFIVQQVLTLENLMVNAVVQGNQSLIDAFKSNVDGYRSRLTAAIEKLGAHIKVYEARGRVYDSSARAQASIAEVDVKAAEAQIQATLSQMSLYVKQAELHMKNAEVSATIRTHAAQGGAQVAAQLAAGIFSGVSVQAHLGANANVGKNYSGQESLSESYPHEDRP